MRGPFIESLGPLTGYASSPSLMIAGHHFTFDFSLVVLPLDPVDHCCLLSTDFHVVLGSARVWKHKCDQIDVEQQAILGDNNVEEGPVLYGHGGRVWDCHFTEQVGALVSCDGSFANTFLCHCCHSSVSNMGVTAVTN